MPYAVRDDVYVLGLSAQAFVVRPRPFDAVDITTATIRLKAHGLTVDDVITFEATSGGMLPTGISGFTQYYPVAISTDLFRVATSSGGTPITSWVSAGSGWGVTIDPGRRIDAHLVETAAEIDQFLTAHLPPIEVDPNSGLYPQILIGLNARMAARAAVTSLQVENAAYRVAVDRLMAREVSDLAMLDKFREGWPLNPRPTDQDTVADNSAIASSSRDAVGWTTGSL